MQRLPYSLNLWACLGQHLSTAYRYTWKVDPAESALLERLRSEHILSFFSKTYIELIAIAPQETKMFSLSVYPI